MNSTGIDFFPFSVDFFDDDKIQLIEGEFGDKGGYVAIRLLCKIFSTSGYYYQWGEDECLLFKRRLGEGYTRELINNVVDALARRSFFDKRILDEHGCLTSRGIQTRYFEAVKKRKSVAVRRELLLIDVSSFKNVVIFNKIVDFFEEKGDISEQSKVKESKVKESNSSSFSSSSSSSSSESKKEESEEEQQQKILSSFFFKNWASPEEEIKRFMAFNNTGGRCWAKMDMTEREAAAELWKQKPAKPPRFPPDFLQMWQRVYDFMLANGASLQLLRDATSDSVGYAIEGPRLWLRISSALRDYIEANIDMIGSVILAFMKKKDCNKLQYNTIKNI